MTDESSRREWPPGEAASQDPKSASERALDPALDQAEHAGSKPDSELEAGLDSEPEAGAPDLVRRGKSMDVAERERADSIAPMSSPIVSIGDDEPVRSDRAPATSSNPPAPSVRRLVPPPKPKNYESRPPPQLDPPLADLPSDPTLSKRPHFPAPEFPSTPAPSGVPVRAPSLAPDLGALRAAASQRPNPLHRPSIPPAEPSNDKQRDEMRPAAQVSPPPPLPQSLTFPGPRAVSRPPPTLPSAAAIRGSTIPRPGSDSDERTSSRQMPAAVRVPAVPNRSTGGRSDADFSLGEPQIFAAASDAGASSRELALPPAARRTQTLPSDPGPPPSSSPGRAAVLPKATRDAVRRSSTPPPKPRLVPQRPVKETPTVAIQAMRIIAIGTEGVPAAIGASPSEVESSAPENLAPPRTPSSPESSGPDIEAFETTTAELELPDSLPPDAPMIAGDALKDMPPLPDAALLDMQELPEVSLADPVEVDTPPPLPTTGLELYPLAAEPAPPPVEATSKASSAGAKREAWPVAAPVAADELPPASEPAPESIEPVDVESSASARKRPPPPKRISLPTPVPTEGAVPSPITSSIPPSPPSSMQIAAAPAVETAPRQPPPAPSRVPREPQQRPAAPERAPASTAQAPVATAPDASTQSASTQNAEKPKTRPRRPWWEELFGEDFSRATARLSEAQIDQEVSFIEESLGVAPGGALLDLGCGAGLHAVELASRGYGIVGYDLSLHQLALAQEVAQERKQKLNFLQGDMREMAFEEVFDGMYCWNTTFGYFEEDKNLLVAERMFAALKPGGTLLLDVVNRDFVAGDQPSSVWYEGDSCVCMDDMAIDFFTSRLRVKRSLILDDGRTRECHYSIRLYSLHELGKLLHDIGFRVTEASGHPATPGVFLGQSSPRIIILAQKP